MSGTVSDNTSQSSGSITEPAGGVSIVSSDPTLTEGLLWYNSTANVLKVARDLTAWSAGGTLLVVRRETAGHIGTITATFVSGGTTTSSRVLTSEEYDGTCWTAGGNMAVARNGCCQFGTLTAGVNFTGWDAAPNFSNDTEEYDGTSWATSNDVLQGGYGAGGCGVQTAGLSTCTFDDSTLYNSSEEYDGTSWTDGGDMPSGYGYGVTACGTQTAALAAGAYTKPGGSATYHNDALTYNGSTWSAISDISEEKREAAAFGVQSDATVAGGLTSSAVVSTVQTWNGSAWSTASSLATIRYASSAGGASGTSGIVAGGNSGSTLSSTEEYASGVIARTLSNS